MMTSGSNAPRAASASASFVPARAVVRCPSPSNRIASISRTAGSSSTIRIAPVGPASSAIRFPPLGSRCLFSPSGTSMAKTDPRSGQERTSMAWPRRSLMRCTMERPRPRPRFALAGWVVELMEFLEDRLQLSRGNAYPVVPHLNVQLVAASAAAEQDLAPFGIFYGVRQQVAERLLEQTRLASHVQTARDRA